MSWVVLAIAGFFLLLGLVGWLASKVLEPKTKEGKHG